MRVIYLLPITALALLALLLAAVAALRAQGQQILQGMLNTVAVVYERDFVEPCAPSCDE